MSNNSLSTLIAEISHEITRDAKGWYFSQAAASRICGMQRSTIGEGLSQGAGLGLPVRGGKLLKSIAAQGISPAGLEDFKRQWSEGRVSDLMVSCLITYAATQKMGEKDPQVVALHGLITGAGLRGMLDQAFGVEDVGGRVMARLDGISHRVTYAGDLAQRKRNIGAYTAAITAAITGHNPKTWRERLLPGAFGKGTGRIRDHADPTTLRLIKTCEEAATGMEMTTTEAAKFAAEVKRAAMKYAGYSGSPTLSPAKLTPKTSRAIEAGKKSKLADAQSGELLPLLEQQETDSEDG
jgi:hypothetical protein